MAGSKRRTRSSRALATAAGTAALVAGAVVAGPQPAAALSSHDVGCESSSGRKAHVTVWYKWDYSYSDEFQIIWLTSIKAIKGNIDVFDVDMWYQPSWYDGAPQWNQQANGPTMNENLNQGSSRSIEPTMRYSPYSIYEGQSEGSYTYPYYSYTFKFTDGTSCTTPWANAHRMRKF